MDFDDFPDTEALEIKSRTRKKKTDKDEKVERAYKMRCRMVTLSKSYSLLLQYIRDNTNALASMEYEDKECMRRLCQRAYDTYSPCYSMDELNLFDRVFGPYIPERKSHTIYEGRAVQESYYAPEPATLEEKIIAYTDTMYHTFFEFLSDEEVQDQLKKRPDLKFRVQNMIDANRIHNAVPVYNRGFKQYESSDEVLFNRVLDSMGGTE